ncbi:ABC transporter ATP-binding protein [Neomegalonema sp.]|uniref:ABC transporter ATP-binding protein n=1 Tax=Neomegalonema sp. TaxID=2039713 RepID=UPI00260DF425|nr:ABC transporter ATP-binding protein [Neomegalonema sp.]MDD2867977.1 ABC transporter ATP-binding protein [Neomegalonema sp.]
MTERPMPARLDKEPPRTFRDRWIAMRNIPPFLKMAWDASPGLMSASLALRLMRALIPVAMLWIGKLIIDEILRLIGLQPHPADFAAWRDSGEADWLFWLVLAEFGLGVLADLLGRLGGLVESLLSERMSMATSLRLMEHAARLDLEDFEDAAFQDKLERARQQAGSTGLIWQVFGQLQNLLSITAFSGALIAYNPWLMALMGLSLVPAFLGEAWFNARKYDLDYQRTQERREMNYVRQTGSSAETAKEVKIFGLNDFLIDRYRTLALKFYAANRRIARQRAAWGALFESFGAMGYYLAYAWIIFGALTGTLTLGDLTFLSGAFQRMKSQLETMLTSFSATASQAMYLEDLFSFFRIQPEIDSPAQAVAPPRPIREGFVFENVGFHYPGSERWAVRGLDFTLKAGETMALVGENGAGKTTLVKLLARLYDPDEGRILLDGRDLRDYDLDALRGSMGVIFQDFVRYNLTAGENIAVGRIEARGDQARIEQAAARSGADEVIRRLPKGYGQMVGKRFRNGVELSGGEWQKIAISRAYMREAEVLILDEPTAALDARSEYEVFKRFKELSAGKTSVLISHRFSSVRMADRIMVLGGGRVEDLGTHEELLGRKGRYAELFELQAAGYR